ncbi:hypothetical protein QO010_003926 [Caulobacter ginsengisoli]|uniref:Lmo0937 family membrane protein n=1 Tax=Caulobacter ginsengisoli TaxID=400775 RepID=A0ABU0IVV3_9CAUL|nr:lmo0937 family membrane protein [Caulobacter ginsengisoli]MDQ0466133.1 hypothetical protein [Caulobacter ginsengisoli]
MLYAIAAVLVVLWLLGFIVMHVSSFLIHLLLLAAVVVVVMHIVRGRKAP